MLCLVSSISNRLRMRSRSARLVTSSSSLAWPRTIRKPPSRSAGIAAPGGEPGRDHLLGQRRRAGCAARSISCQDAASRPRRSCGRPAARSGSCRPRSASRPTCRAARRSTRFSTMPLSVTTTTSARPGDSGTNSMCLNGRSTVGRRHEAGIARQAGERVRRRRVSTALDAAPGTGARLSISRRSSSLTLPTSSRPST